MAEFPVEQQLASRLTTRRPMGSAPGSRERASLSASAASRELPRMMVRGRFAGKRPRLTDRNHPAWSGTTPTRLPSFAQDRLRDDRRGRDARWLRARPPAFGAALVISRRKWRRAPSVSVSRERVAPGSILRCRRLRDVADDRVGGQDEARETSPARTSGGGLAGSPINIYHPPRPPVRPPQALCGPYAPPTMGRHRTDPSPWKSIQAPGSAFDAWSCVPRRRSPAHHAPILE